MRNMAEHTIEKKVCEAGRGSVVDINGSDPER